MSSLGEARFGIRVRALLFCSAGLCSLAVVSMGILGRSQMVFSLVALYAFGEVVLALPGVIRFLDSATAPRT